MTENTSENIKKAKQTPRKRKAQEKKTAISEAATNAQEVETDNDVKDLQIDAAEVKAAEPQKEEEQNTLPNEGEKMEKEKADVNEVHKPSKQDVAFQHLFGYLWNGQAVDY